MHTRLNVKLSIDFFFVRLNEKLPLFKLQTSDDEEDEEEDGNDESDKTKATTENPRPQVKTTCSPRELYLTSDD